MTRGSESRNGPEEAAEGRPPERKKLDMGRKLRIAAVAATALVALLLVVQNQAPTRTQFLVWSVEMPRFALLGFVYLLGTATGWILRRRGAR